MGMDAAPFTTLPSLLTETQAAEALALSVRTLQAWRTRGTGPSYIKAGNAVRYNRASLAEWAELHTVQPDRPAPGEGAQRESAR